MTNSQKELIVKLGKEKKSERKMSVNLNILFATISSFIARYKNSKNKKLNRELQRTARIVRQHAKKNEKKISTKICKSQLRTTARGWFLLRLWRNATCHLVALIIIQATSAPNLIITSINLNQSPI